MSTLPRQKRVILHKSFFGLVERPTHIFLLHTLVLHGVRVVTRAQRIKQIEFNEHCASYYTLQPSIYNSSYLQQISNLHAEIKHAIKEKSDVRATQWKRTQKDQSLSSNKYDDSIPVRKDIAAQFHGNYISIHSYSKPAKLSTSCGIIILFSICFRCASHSIHRCCHWLDKHQYSILLDSCAHWVCPGYWRPSPEPNHSGIQIKKY